MRKSIEKQIQEHLNDSKTSLNQKIEDGGGRIELIKNYTESAKRYSAKKGAVVKKRKNSRFFEKGGMCVVKKTKSKPKYFIGGLLKKIGSGANKISGNEGDDPKKGLGRMLIGGPLGLFARGIFKKKKDGSNSKVQTIMKSLPSDQKTNLVNSINEGKNYDQAVDNIFTEQEEKEKAELKEAEEEEASKEDSPESDMRKGGFVKKRKFLKRRKRSKS